MLIKSRATLERELQDLQDDLLVMGSMVEKQIARAVESLRKRDFQEARQVIRADLEINAKRFEIEEQAILIIATQQPTKVIRDMFAFQFRKGMTKGHRRMCLGGAHEYGILVEAKALRCAPANRSHPRLS